LAGDTEREATSNEVKGLRAETHQLKELLAELMIENRVLKKHVLGDGSLIHEARGGLEAAYFQVHRITIYRMVVKGLIRFPIGYSLK
jgi:hypothetical protein